jgi:hypothetical protein
MFLQGNLQNVFDALFAVGAIDPVLKMDWNEIVKDMARKPNHLKLAFEKVNACSENYQDLVLALNQMDQESVSFVAMEVAREYCEFQDRSNLQ